MHVEDEEKKKTFDIILSVFSILCFQDSSSYSWTICDFFFEYNNNEKKLKINYKIYFWWYVLALFAMEIIPSFKNIQLTLYLCN